MIKLKIIFSKFFVILQVPLETLSQDAFQRKLFQCAIQWCYFLPPLFQQSEMLWYILEIIFCSICMKFQDVNTFQHTWKECLWLQFACPCYKILGMPCNFYIQLIVTIARVFKCSFTLAFADLNSYVMWA